MQGYIQGGVYTNRIIYDEVYGYLHETMMETYPDYMLKLNNRDWRKIYEGYMDNPFADSPPEGEL